MSSALMIDASKCVGCRTCEVICSLTHSKGVIDPRRSSVRVYREDSDRLVLQPVVKGPDESIGYLVKPDPEMVTRTWNAWGSVVPRECNLCGMCAQWCVTGAITFRKEN